MSNLSRRDLGRMAIAAAIGGAGPTAGVFPAQAQGGNPLRIGMSMSLSGGLAGNGRAALAAQQIWAADVNAKGGLLGRPVQLVFYDDQTNGGNVPGIYTKLIDVDKVDLVTSPYATAMIAPAMPVVMQHGMCFVTILGAGVNSAFNYDRHFNMNVTGDDMKTTYAKGYLDVADTLPQKPRSIAILAVDNDFAQRAAESARFLARQRNIRIVYDVPTRPARWTSPPPCAPSRRPSPTSSTSPVIRRTATASYAPARSSSWARRCLAAAWSAHSLPPSRRSSAPS